MNPKRVKLICKKCKKHHHKVFYRDAKGCTRSHRWGVSEGMLWEQKGKVICVKQGNHDHTANQKGRYIWEEPPDDCPYLLEHLVILQRELK